MRLSRKFLGQFSFRRAFSRRANSRASLEELGVVRGSRHSGFLVTSVEDIPEFNVRLVQLLHEDTKARHVHIDSDDTNNVFSVVFRTPPFDSTGLPHILEHCVLCGSEAFPVRDPFFNMLKRSLNTFMNAMTTSDFTSYPFSTRNEADFANLLSVYLDATFFPLLRENDFLQEGHRLEIDSEGNLTRGGVVYNEMKGRRSSSSALFLFEMSSKLFEGSGSCYRHDSGGIPENIPELSWEQLQAFHQRCYHPSNALFFTYGDLPLPTHLEAVQQVTDRFTFDPIAAVTAKAIPPTDEITSGTRINISGPLEGLGDADKQTKFCLIKTLPFETTDEYKSMVARVLNNLLLEGLNSPLYSKLISSGLAPDYSPGVGYDGYLLVPSFSIGVQNIKEDQIEVVKEAIFEELNRVAKEGFPEQMVEATLHQIELQLKHKQTHFGLMLLQAVSKSWTHTVPDSADSVPDLEASIIESVSVEEKLRRLRQECREPGFWENIVKELLLNETPFREFVMTSKESYLEELEAGEKTELKQIEQGLSQEDKENIKNKSEELTLEREKIADLSCLPTLSLNDIPRVATDEVDLSFIDGTAFPNIKESTNDVVYLKLLFDASRVNDDRLLMYVPLLCSLLGHVDTESLSFQELSLETQLNCGGISFDTVVPNWLGSDELARDRRISSFIKGDRSKFRQGIMISTHCLRRNLGTTLELILHSLTGSDFSRNPEHLQTLVSTCASTANSSLTENALSYARRWTLAPFGEDNALNELLAGVTQVQHIAGINNTFTPERLSRIFENLCAIIFHPRNLQVKVVSYSDRHFIQNEISAFKGNLAWRSRSAGLRDLLLTEAAPSEIKARKADATYIPLPIPVHNAVCALSTGVGFHDENSEALSVLSELISSNFLHPRIREKGGAYGSQAMHNQSGILTLSSYFDPNTTETLKVFEDSLDWVCEGKFSKRDVDEALLSMFSSIDAPRNLAQKGQSEFLHGLTKDKKQEYRDKFFSLNKETLIKVANDYLGCFVNNLYLNNFGNMNEDIKNKVGVSIIGNTESSSQFREWLQYKTR